MDNGWREEITENVRDVVKENRQVADLVRQAANREGGIRSKAKWLKDQCELYANRHNGNFGELFVAELDAAYWSKIVQEHENVT